MSVMKTTLASVGVGAAHVDAVLDTDRVCPGDEITGTVRVHGGRIAQAIEYLGVALMTRYKQHTHDRNAHVNHALSETRVREAFEVAPGDTLEMPFTVQVPWETPVTLGKTQVWLQTALAVSRARDPKGRGSLRVEPNEGMATVLQAFEQLGFTLHKADCARNYHNSENCPFIQQFLFTPGASYADRLTELEIAMTSSPRGVHLWVEADLRTSGVAGVVLRTTKLNERFTQVDIDQPMLRQGTDAVAAKLGQRSTGA